MCGRCAAPFSRGGRPWRPARPVACRGCGPSANSAATKKAFSSTSTSTARIFAKRAFRTVSGDVPLCPCVHKFHLAEHEFQNVLQRHDAGLARRRAPAQWPAAGRRAASGATRLPAACLHPGTAPASCAPTPAFPSPDPRGTAAARRRAIRRCGAGRRAFPRPAGATDFFSRASVSASPSGRLISTVTSLRQRRGDLADGEILQIQHAVDHRAFVAR